MPITFLAHQSLVLPLKTRWPDRFDGTALVIGSMAPDLAYAFDGYMVLNAHSVVPAIAFCLPLTFAVCAAIRERIAVAAFGALPDAGPFRLRSWAVLGNRSPPWLQTLWSAAIGVVSHILADGFTHVDRFGSSWIPALGVERNFPGGLTTSWAHLLQWVGHVGGTLACLMMLFLLGRYRGAERWYGTRTVAAARARALDRTDLVRFWSVVAVGAGFGVAWALQDALIHTRIIRGALGLAVGVAVASWLVPSSRYQQIEAPRAYLMPDG